MARSSVVNIIVKVSMAGGAVLGRLSGGLRSLKDQIFSLKTAYAAVAAFVVGTLGKKLVGAFAEQEQAIIRLNAALRVTGRFSAEGSKEIQNMATEMQRLTTVADEAALGASATIATFAKELDPHQLAELQKAAIGLAQALGTDVDSAAIALGKTLNGETNALGRLGISIDMTASQTDRYAEIMRKTGPLFEIAKESTKSLQGQFAQAANQVGELKETFGQVIAESLGLTNSHETLAEKIENLNKDIRENMGTWVHWGKVAVEVTKFLVRGLIYLIRGFFNVGQIIGRVLKSSVVTVANIVKAFFNAGQIVGDVFVLAFLGTQAAFEKFRTWLVDKINGLIIAFNKISPLDIPLIEQAPEVFSELLADGVANLKRDAKDFEDAAGNIAGTWVETAEGIAGDIQDMTSEADNFASSWQNVVAALNSPIQPPQIFNRNKGAGANTGPRAGPDPVAMAKRLEQASKDLQRQFDQNDVSVDAFVDKLREIGPAMVALLESGALSGDDLAKLRAEIDALRQTSEAVGLTFDANGVKAQSFGQIFQKQVRAAVKAAGSLNKVIAEMATQTFAAFGNAVSAAFAAMVDGSQSAGKAFLSAMLGALAQVAAGFGQFFLAKATAALGEVFLGNPAALAAAAKFTAAAVAMFALSGVLQGVANRASGSGGGAAAAPAAQAQERAEAASREEPPATLVIEGGILDMTDPRQADALTRALEDLSGRRVTIRLGAEV